MRITHPHAHAACSSDSGSLSGLGGLARGALFLAAVAVMDSSTSAQLQFDELGKRHLPAGGSATFAVALSDVDGDGDFDLVSGNNGQNRLYLNDGNGTFTDETASHLPTDGDVTLGVALSDVDGDGAPDLLCGNDGQNRLYLNDGTGAFTDVTASHLPTDGDYTNAVALADVDGDGDPDLVCGNRGQNRLYRNDGTGVFTDVTASHLPADGDDTDAVALADVDGDGDLDLVLGNGSPVSGGQSRLYLNDGTGRFTDATAARMPAAFQNTHAVALADVDGDGDPDLVLGNAAPLLPSPTAQNRLYLNDGAGTFTEATASHLPADIDDTVAAVLSDVDGDGDPDLVFGNGLHGARQNRLCLNDGAGAFTDATASHLPAVTDQTTAAALSDVDGDGDVDLVFGNAGFPSFERNRLYLNGGTGRYADATASHLPGGSGSTNDVAPADVDGDGDTDLVCGNGGQSQLYLNDGTGTFTDATASRLPAISANTNAVALSDVDGDGDPDLVCGNSGQNRLYLNDGTGRYTDVTASRMPIDSDSTEAVAFSDVDGDGDTDLVCGNSKQNRLFLNDGTGSFLDFTASHLPVGSDVTSAMALADVDGDGDSDLLCGNNGQSHLYLNDGTGTFTDVTVSQLPAIGATTNAVAMADVDGDGDPDLVFGNSGQNWLFLNDGTGTFTDVTASHLPADNDSTVDVALSDVDGDGDPDLVLGSGGWEQSRLYLADGSGMFTDVTASRLPPATVMGNATNAVALADVDGDGDADLVLGNLGQNRLYLNLLRQLDVPFLVRPGLPYQLDVYARYGPPRPADSAVLMLSTGTARIPIPPFGTFALEPTLTVIYPEFVIPGPMGIGSRLFPVPRSPSLVGLSIYAQAVLLQVPFGVYLTNWAADRIEP